MRAAILVEDLFDERELIYPFYRLKEMGFQVDLVGPEVKTYRSKLGMEVKADVSAEPELAEAYDVIWIPGGYAPDRLRRSKKVLEMVRRAVERGKIVAAVCHAPWVLISAGVVKGRRLTGFHSIWDDLRNAGAYLTEEEAVVDGNIITGTGPDAMPEMMRLLRELIGPSAIPK
jgi:protease I